MLRSNCAFSGERAMAALAASLVCLGLLTSCAQEVPLVTQSTTLTNDTLSEQRVWLAEEADKAIAASGVPDGWHERLYDRPSYPWTGPSEERDRYVEGIFPRECAGSNSGRLNFGLNNDVVLENPFLVADRVRDFWEAEGWTTSDVTPPNDYEVYFRADREDGAILGFTASEQGLLVEVMTSCSVNESVGNWMAHLDDENESKEERAFE